MKASVISGLLGSLVVAVVACGAPGASGEDAAEKASTHENSSGAGVNSGAAGATGSGTSGHGGVDAAKLSVHLVDAPTDEVTSIVVTIAKIEASMNGEWLTLAEEEHTIDLLTLQNGAFLDLGMTVLPPGHVEQVRLRLAEGGDHHVVTPDGVQHPLDIPSGEQSGIKLVGGFDLAPCSNAQLTIDFDGRKSLFLQPKPGSAGGGGSMMAGAPTDGGTSEGGTWEGDWKLRPVIRIKALLSKGTCEADAGSPTEDPCAEVTCSETEICDNGTCRAAEQ